LIELVLYGTEWWCLYETSNINLFWYDTHVLIEYDGLSLNISWSSFPQMMDVTIVTTTEIVHANDMISLPNPNDLQSYYIVYSTHFFYFFLLLMICSHTILYIVLVHHLYALTLCMSEMLNIRIIVMEHNML